VRILAVSAMLASAAAIALAALVALRPPPTLPRTFDQLTVGRLDVVEPDGTPRMILASRARFPGSFSRGREIARPNRRDYAGILFVDDEGTENGGLIQAGALDATGKVAAGLSLTFDRFRQDQMLQLLLDESGDQASAGVLINDQPSYRVFSIDDMFRLADETSALTPAARDAELARHRALGHFGAPRGYFGTRDGAASLVLNDPQGRPRLRLAVSVHGEPAIELLDDAGRVVRTIDGRTP